MKAFSKENVRRGFLSTAAVLLLAATVMTSMTSCGKGYYAESSADNYYSGSASAGVDYDYSYSEMEKPSDALYDEIHSESANDTAQQTDHAARKLIKNANLTVETKNFDEFMGTLEGNILAMGGYLSSSSVNGNSYGANRSRYANLTVRIPADTYDAFVSGIGGYGNVTYRSETVSDVTMAYVDTESRIKAYEAEYETLLEILGKAERLDDILVIQNRITEVTYQLESYKSQLRKYDDLVSYCTVCLNISEVVELTEIKEPPQTVLQRMGRGITDTWEDVVEDAEDFAVGFVSAIPVLVIWAIVVVVVIFIAKGIAKGLNKKVKKASPSDDNSKKD